MDINEIQQYLETNKDSEDVKGFIGKLTTPNLDLVKGFLDSNEDGKKYLQSLTDAKVTKGIESFKANNLQKLIDDAIKLANPEATPEQLKIRELEQKWEASEKKAQLEQLRNVAIKAATDKKIPSGLIDFLIGENEETTLSNIANFEQLNQSYIQSVIEDRIKSNTYTPPNGGSLTEIQQLEAAYAEALKSNNFALQISLKNKLFEKKKG